MLIVNTSRYDNIMIRSAYYNTLYKTPRFTLLFDDGDYLLLINSQVYMFVRGSRALFAVQITNSAIDGKKLMLYSSGYMLCSYKVHIDKFVELTGIVYSIVGNNIFRTPQTKAITINITKQLKCDGQHYDAYDD